MGGLEFVLREVPPAPGRGIAWRHAVWWWRGLARWIAALVGCGPGPAGARDRGSRSRARRV